MISPVDKTSEVNRLYGTSSHDSVDSQFTEPDDEVDEELRFFDACVECDDDALYDVIHDGLTWDEVNKRDKSGRVSLTSLCSLLISVSSIFTLRIFLHFSVFFPVANMQCNAKQRRQIFRIAKNYFVQKYRVHDTMESFRGEVVAPECRIPEKSNNAQQYDKFSLSLTAANCMEVSSK